MYVNRGRPIPGEPIGDRPNAVNWLNNSSNNPIKRFVYAPSKNIIIHVFQSAITQRLLLFILTFSYSIASCNAQENHKLTALSQQIIEKCLSEEEVLKSLSPQQANVP